MLKEILAVQLKIAIWVVIAGVSFWFLHDWKIGITFGFYTFLLGNFLFF